MCGTRPFSIFSLCLMLFFALPGFLSSANAQQEEKRIALVVGDGAYAKSPLATAANDAGLIAQTLQAAGFDVVGARDLDADTLRKSFRDFIQKAEQSGPGTVAMVYLSGYGIQLAGENYFIPVDSSVSRDVDIPIEGLRISDYTRQLASLPLKAGIVVLDAARQQPFIEGGQPIASGLALVEPDPHMLVAFNAAPGTVAANEQGNYGVYAQSLAEMIRTGGLPLPEVFNRLRLRVNDASKGAQVPWDAEKIDAQFMFFDRAPDAPAPAPPDQVAAIRNKPIRDLGVQDAYAAVLERDTLPGYEDFLAAYPGDPLARRVRAIVAARREAITWSRTYQTDTPQAYWSYLRRYPRGPHAYDARRRLAILTAPLEPPPSFAVVDYDVPPPPPDEIVYVDRPVLMFDDPEFDFAPPPPPPIFFLPPPPPDFVVLPPPIAPIGLFILPQPLFVPIPVYVQPPVYVAPPPNNIIFANIHNTTVINNVINQPPAPVAPAAPGAPAAAPGAPAAPAAPGAPAAPATANAQPGVTPAAKSGPGQAAATPATAAGPQLPPSVRQRASLIQQGKLPVPASASINPAAKPGAPGAASGQKGGPNTPSPANLSPNALPKVDVLPKANALPVPGTKGAPPAPPATTGPVPGVAPPSAKLTPENKSATTTPTTTSPTGPPSGPGAAGAPKTPGTTGPAPGVTTPTAKLTPENKRATTTPAGPASGPGAAGAPKTPGANPPKATALGPGITPLEKRKDVAPPPPPKPVAAPPKPPPPVAHVEPTHRAAPPPPPPPRPAPQIARPAPPPPPRPAPPPPPPPHPAAQAVRPAPPPPPPRPAPPPPPKPAPAAAKKCPPNVEKC
jgi:uncharacterized caspase-like protein